MTLPSLAFDAAVLAVLPYPRIDPVAFSLGPFVLRWYALSYLAGVLGAWWLLRRVAYAAATGGFHGAVARFVEARDRASPGLGGASWTHAAEKKSEAARGPARREAVRRARRTAARREAAARAARQRKRTLQQSGRRAQSRARSRARSEQRERLQAQMRSDLRAGTPLRASGGRGGGDGDGDGGRRRRGDGARDDFGRTPLRWTFAPPAAIDEFVTWGIFGMLLGGRLGYVFAYNWEYYRERPVEILYLWEGGMSFHGGVVGVLLLGLLYSRWRRIPFLALSDLVTFGCTIGLFFGRIANFVNGELYGRASDVPWAVIFPAGGDEPRHPSQLYEALGEGLFLFLVLGLLVRLGALYYHGMVTAAAFIGYGVVRFGLEFTREPDAQVGYLLWGLSMGQWLSAPMVLIGLMLLSVRTGRIRPINIS